MRRLRKGALWLLAGLAAVLLVPVLVMGWFVFLAGESVWTAAVAEGLEAASDETMALSAEGVSRDSDGIIRLGRLSVADPEGDWLVIEGLALDLDVAALAGREARIAGLRIERVSVLRAPAADEVSEPTNEIALPERIDLPDLPVSIDLKTLEIGEIVLAEAVVPDGLRLGLTGHARIDGSGADVALAAIPKDLDRSRVSANLKLDRASGDLAVDVDGDLPLIERLRSQLAAPEDSRLTVHLTGGGPLDNSRIDIGLGVGGVLDLTGQVSVSPGESGGLALGLESFIDLVGGVAAEPAAMLGPFVAVNLQANLPDATRLNLTELGIDAQYLQLQTSGQVDLDKQSVDLEGRMTLHPSDGVLALAAGGDFDSVEADFHASGPVEALKATVTAQVLRPGFDTFGAESLTADVDTQLTGDGADGTLKLALTEPSTPDPALAPWLGSGLTLATGFQAAPDRVRLSGLALETARATMGGDLVLDPASTAISGALTVTASPASWPELADLLEAGKATITARLDGFRPEGGTVALQAGLTDLRLRDPTLRAVTGNELGLSGTVDLAGSDVAADLSLRTAGALSGNVKGGLAGTQIDAKVAAQLASVPAGLLPPDIKGLSNIRLSARVEGAVDSPRVQATVVASDFEASGQRVQNPRIAINAENLTAQPVVAAGITASIEGAPITVKTVARAAADFVRVVVDRFQADGLGATVAATADIDVATGLATSAADIRIADLGTLAPFIGQPLSGAFDARLETLPRGGRLDAMVTAKVAGVGTADATVAGITADVALADLLSGSPALDGQIAIDGVKADGAALDRATIDLAGRALGPIARIQARLVMPAELTLDTQVQADLGNPNALSIVASTLTVSGEPGSISAEAPFEVRVQGDAIALAGLRLTSSFGGRLAGDLAYAPDRISGDLTVEALPVGPLAALAGQADVTGRINARLNADTARAANRAQLDLTVANVALPDLPSDRPFDLTVQAGWRGEQAVLDARLGGPFDQPMVARLSGDLPPAADAPFPSPPENGRVEGQVTWQGDLAQAMALLPEGDHLAAGATTVDVVIGGVWSDPVLSGTVALADGRYENLLSGTQLSAIGLDIAFDDRGTGQIALSARGPEEGTISGSGEVVLLGADRGGRFDLAIRNLLALRRDEIRALLSGDSSVIWDGTRLGVTVRKTLDRVDVFLAEPDLPPSVVAIDLADEQAAEPVSEDDGAAALPVDLDVEVTSPGQFFVRGRGLESEWRGTFRVTGTADEPIIRSRFEAVRGSLALLGRDFRLETGELGLDEQFDPTFRIVLSRTAGDLLGRVTISGSPAQPDIAFSSEPELPADEVLPRIMFDKAKQSLSPLEAVSLAQSIRTLSNGKPGTTDRIRSAVGLDVLRFEEGDTEDSAGAVSVGRYVREGVYVGAKKSVDSDAGSVVVEIDVLPNVKVDAEVGQGGGGSTGITWEKKY